MKKLILIILFLGTMLILCSFKESDDFYRYEIEDGNVVIISYSGFDKNLNIPEKIDDYTVTRIEESAFYGNDIIREITIPSTVKEIGKYAFSSCPYLNTVEFLNGECTIIREGAFMECPLLSDVTFPDSLVTIDDFAFKNCGRLGQVYFPKSISDIGYEAFNGCESLVMNIKDCQAAKDYSEKYSIITEYKDSSEFLWLKVFSGTAILFAISFISVKLYNKNKFKKIINGG